jgi:oligopeptide/dipeptide ABC transporter ATP-binding protein
MPSRGTEPISEPGQVLAVEGLRTHFDTRHGVVRAVDGVSFTLARGEVLALVGESGSGKSVTGLSIMRLLHRGPGRIIGGRVLLSGRDGSQVDLTRLADALMRAIRGHDIAMIFQDPMSSLNPVLTVGEQIAEAIVQHRRVPHRDAWREAVALLGQVGIPAAGQRARDYPHQFSGGMRQRAMIAIALACEPQVLIADEPTAALDVTIQAQIVALLARLCRERRLGVIFISHDLRLVADIADRIAVMYCGEVVEQGPTAAVLEEPRHPYTMALLACLPWMHNRGALRPIPGAPADPTHPPNGCRFYPRCAFAQEACRRAPPPMMDADPGHTTRCLRQAMLAEGDAARA